jgi:hypothetical protein
MSCNEDDNKKRTKSETTKAKYNDDGSLESLQYSSSDSSNLRPSSTIQRNSDIDRQSRMREEWCKIFNQSQKEQTISSASKKNYTQVKLKVLDTENLPFGDDITASSEGIKILFHNINGIKDEANWYQIITTMMELQVDIPSTNAGGAMQKQ